LLGSTHCVSLPPRALSLSLSLSLSFLSFVDNGTYNGS
jgi:hypothetical protein